MPCDFLQDFFKRDVFICMGSHNIIHRLGSLNNKMHFLIVMQVRKLKFKVLAESVPGKSYLSDLWMATFLLCLYVVERERQTQRQTGSGRNFFLFFWGGFFFCFIFINYAMTIVPIFPFLPSTKTHYSLRQSAHHHSRPWVMCKTSLTIPFPMLYFTSPWLFCNHLFVLLNPLTSSPIPPHSPPIWQPTKYSLYP